MLDPLQVTDILSFQDPQTRRTLHTHGVRPAQRKSLRSSSATKQAMSGWVREYPGVHGEQSTGRRGTTLRRPGAQGCCCISSPRLHFVAYQFRGRIGS